MMLNPFTNDPYLDSKGRLKRADKSLELQQRFSVLVHTRAGTDVFNYDYGLDYERIDNSLKDPFTALFEDLMVRIARGVEPKITSFEILEGERVGNHMSLRVIVRGPAGSVEVKIDES